MRRKDYAEAIRRFEAAIDLDARAVPAYLNLGDVRVAAGQRARGGGDLGEADRGRAGPRLPRVRSARGARVRTGNPERFTRLCRRLIDENPQDWRARLALSRHLAGERPAAAKRSTCCSPRSCRTRTRSASTRRSGARSASCTIPPSLVDRYGELTEHAVFYLDPHVCMRCRYRSTELLWQCPHCHDWNTFVEERIAPAQDTTEVEV